MRIELSFHDVHENIANAIADLRVEDQSEADAPAPQLFSVRIGPFSIPRSQPVVTMDIDLTIPAGDYEAALIVHVKGHTHNNQFIEFLNTTTTPLPEEDNAPVRVVLSRIG